MAEAAKKLKEQIQPAASVTPPKAAPPPAPRDQSQLHMEALAETLAVHSAAADQTQTPPQTAVDLEEIYRTIDEQAVLLAPDEQACYTAQGQQILLDAAVQALPQLGMLNAPGFPGYRIRHAATGAEAYEAMIDLTNSIRQLLQTMDPGQLEKVLASISQQDALLAWKAFRFYTSFCGEEGFEPVCQQLAWRAIG